MLHQAVFLFVLFRFSMYSSAQVNFAPLGAEWIYDNGHNEEDLPLIEHIRSIKDTTVGNQSARVLDRKIYKEWTDGICLTEFTSQPIISQVEDKIYRWTGTRYVRLFDFSIDIGQSYTSEIGDEYYTLDSISYFRFGSADNRIFHYYYCSENQKHSLVINELFGPINHSFSYQNFPCRTSDDTAIQVGCFGKVANRYTLSQDICDANIPYMGRICTAYFETTFYFEDAIGNRDSVVVGYDPDATYLKSQPEFGEEEKNIPFDSILEVRVTKNGAFNIFGLDETQVYKNAITGVGTYDSFLGCRFKPVPMEFISHIKYKPLKLSWDNHIFQDNPCTSGTYLAHSTFPFTVFDWVDVVPKKEYECMSVMNSINYNFQLNKRDQYFLVDPITGNDTIWGALLYYDGKFNSCGKRVSTSNIIIENELKIWPIPPNDHIGISSDIGFRFYEIFNLNGEYLNKGLFEEDISIHSLPTALFYIKLYTADNNSIVQKFIKM